MIFREEYFRDKKNFIDEKYKVHTAIILNNIGRPVYTYIDEQKDVKVCRYCGKTEHETEFRNKSHVVPKFLGNFLVISNTECDECNSHFSRYETELEKYIKIPLIVNRNNKDLKDRIGVNISRVGDEIIVNGKQERVEFNGNYVIKILLKFAYGMLYEKELGDYKNINKSLFGDTLPQITNILDITTRNPFDWNSIVLYEKRDKSEKYVDNILSLNFNMKKYIVFFNKDHSNHKIDDDIIMDKYYSLFNDLDIYNYRIRNLDNQQVQIKYNIDIFMELIKNSI